MNNSTNSLLRIAVMRRYPPRIVLFVAAAVWVCFISGNWVAGLSFAASSADSPDKQTAKVISNVAYTKPTGNKADRRQTLDLYLPVEGKSKFPLFVFVHGGFWTLSDDEYRIGPSLADVLQKAGVGVALVRYRLAPSHRHPTQAQDVAAAVAYLVREAPKNGYDSSRIFLAGHSAGAHLAALVALNPAYLAAHRLTTHSIAGVVAISGIYDLHPKAWTDEIQIRALAQAFSSDPAMLRSASPISHVSANAPPFLILGAASDFPGFLIDAKKFTDALRNVGHGNVDQFIMPERDHFSIVRLSDGPDEVRILLLDFLKVKPSPPEVSILVEAKRRWVKPPFSTVPFWRHHDLIRSYPVDREFVERLVHVYDDAKYELMEWPLEFYYAMDLFAYLDSLLREEVGRGDYLIITNIRNEKQFWNRRQVEPYRPVLVIGIDDEKNLFKLGVFYRALREYSWKSGARPPMMARPLGAFIHFLKEPPPEFRLADSHYGLTTNSFRLVEKDPLAPLHGLPKEVYEVMTHRNHCINCHSFRGIGSQSHHVTATNGSRHGGLALPLETYPAGVWKAFIFNQYEVARKIGASPNAVDESARQTLYELVVRYRQKQQTPTK